MQVSSYLHFHVYIENLMSLINLSSSYLATNWNFYFLHLKTIKQNLITTNEWRINIPTFSTLWRKKSSQTNEEKGRSTTIGLSRHGGEELELAGD
jgi:hypothetical protein